MFREILDGLRSLVWSGGPPGVQERRRHVRLGCRYPVQCIFDSRALAGSVVELGPEGMRLELAEPLPPEVSVRVAFAGPSRSLRGRPVTARILWTRRLAPGAHELGCACVVDPLGIPRSWAGLVLSELGFDEEISQQRRSKLRARISLAVTASVIGSPPLQGKVLDLGVGGARVKLPLGLGVGSDVVLDVALPAPSASICLPGRVVNLQPGPLEGRTWLHGVRFHPLEEGRALALSKVIVRLLRTAT